MKVTPEIVREGARQQFCYAFGLSREDAQKAADAMARDESFIAAAILCAEKTMECAKTFGWKEPASLQAGKKPGHCSRCGAPLEIEKQTCDKCVEDLTR